MLTIFDFARIDVQYSLTWQNWVMYHKVTCGRACTQVSVAALSFTLGFVAVTGSYVMRLIPKTQALQAKTYPNLHNTFDETPA